MALLFRFLWFVLLGVVLLNAAVWRRRLQELVARGRMDAREADRLARGAAIAFAVPCAALGLIALWAGYATPMCAGVLSFRDAPSAATSLVVLATWAALLWWLWRGRGAEILGRVGPSLSSRPDFGRTYSPRRVRLVVTAALLAAGVGSAVVSRVLPAEAACQFPPAAE